MHITKDFVQQRKIPLYGQAVLDLLQFAAPDLHRIRSLSENDWSKLLEFCDEAQLTLTVAHLAGSGLPGWVRSRIDCNRSDSAEREARLDNALVEITHRFTEEGIDFLLIKGFGHAHEFNPDASLRSTADIDLYCLPDSITKARDALVGLGYRAIGASRGRHLPPMIRETEWQWRGNYFAADLPLPVDLHYKLWDEKLEHIPGPREDEFWCRRSCRVLADEIIPVLALPDALAFGALHLLMHLLHGDLRLQRAWEIAYFLQHRADDDTFWKDWRQSHHPDIRSLQVTIFCLVQRWFQCRIPAIVEWEAEMLPRHVQLWLRRYAFSPVAALFSENKDELWLNLCLVRSWRGKASVFFRRLLPLQVGISTATGPANTGFQLIRAWSRTTAFICGRMAHHVRTLPTTLFQGLSWCWILANYEVGGTCREFLSVFHNSRRHVRDKGLAGQFRARNHWQI